MSTGLNCIWAGEAQVIVSVYNNKKRCGDVAISFLLKWYLKTINGLRDTAKINIKGAKCRTSSSS
jgi:hypothetical protein